MTLVLPLSPYRDSNMKFMLYHPLNCNTPGDPIYVTTRTQFESLLQEGFLETAPDEHLAERARLCRKYKCTDDILDEVLQCEGDKKDFAEMLMENKKDSEAEIHFTDEPWKDFNITDDVKTLEELKEEESIPATPDEPIVAEVPKVAPKVVAKRKAFQAKVVEQ